MAGTPQPISNLFPIVDGNGKPTLYFMKWAQARQIDIEAGITAAQANTIIEAFFAEHPLIEGTGVTLLPSGNVADDVTVSLADTAVTPDTYGDATHVAQITVDQQGRITNAAEVAISGGGGGGGLAMLEQHTAANSASLDFTTAISATYDEYMIEFVDVVPANNNVNPIMRMSTNGGSTYDAGANYNYNVSGLNRFGLGQTGVDSGGTSILLAKSAVDNTTLLGVNGSIRLFAPLSATRYKAVEGQLIAWVTGGLIENQLLGGSYRIATAVNAFQFLMTAGNIASGTIRVYGVAK